MQVLIGCVADLVVRRQPISGGSRGDVVSAIEVVRYAVMIGMRRHGLMEGRVEHGYMRTMRKQLPRDADSEKIMGVVQGCEPRYGSNCRDDLVVNLHGIDERLSAVDHPVADPLTEDLRDLGRSRLGRRMLAGDVGALGPLRQVLTRDGRLTPEAEFLVDMLQELV